MTSYALVLLSAAAAGHGFDGVLLDFSATWCGPCQRVKPIVERLKRQGYPIRKVDIDRERSLARRFRIKAVPTFVLLVNGNEVQRFTGPISERKMRQLMARIPRASSEEKSSDPPNRNREVADAPQSLYGSSNTEPPKPKRRFQLPLSTNTNTAENSKSQQVPNRLNGAVVRANLDAANRLPDAKIPAPPKPIAASVRIRVQDRQGINYGSGTVIQSRKGRAVVLTCGHIFRGMARGSEVTVDLFDGSETREYTGKIVTYDLKADVGLVTIATEDTLPASPVASLKNAPRKGDELVGIGCGGGKPPRRIAVQVTGVDRYLGPGNLECTRMPQQGRSGGGLFDRSGRLVGVCFAAEPRNRRGLYASLRPVHALLQKAGINLRPVETDANDIRLASNHPKNAEGREVIQIDHRQLALMQVPFNDDKQTLQEDSVEVASGPFPPVPPKKNPAADRRNLRGVDDVFEKSGAAEVVCVIRPLDDPKAPSKVVIINRASPKFVRYLQNEVAQQPRKTSRIVKWRDRLPKADRFSTSNRGTHRRSGKLVSPFRPVGGATGRRKQTPIESGRYRRSARTR